MSNNNRLRALADIVSTDAWHEAFSAKKSKADLHIDVVFGVGRIGGGDPSNVRFRLSLKQAEIVVIIPENEPATIVTDSVRRDAPKPISGIIKTQKIASKKLEAGIDGKAGLKLDGIDAGAKIKGGAGFSIRNTKTVTENFSYNGMTIMQNTSPDGHPRWLIAQPGEGSALNGRAWDAKKSPLLEIMDRRQDRSKGIAPSVRVEIRCLREDLIISNIVLSDQSAWAKLQRRKASKNRQIAAEAAIRTMLAEEGLLCGDLSDPYAQICLASTVAQEI